MKVQMKSSIEQLPLSGMVNIMVGRYNVIQRLIKFHKTATGWDTIFPANSFLESIKVS